MTASSSGMKSPAPTRRPLRSVHATASGNGNATGLRLILVHLNWSMVLFQAEDTVKDFMRRAEAAVLSAISRFTIEGVEYARLALVLTDASTDPHVTFIGERTETYEADSPLGSAILKVVQAELVATSS